MLTQSSPEMRKEFMNDYYFGRNAKPIDDNTKTWGGKMDNLDTFGNMNIGQDDNKVVKNDVQVVNLNDVLESERQEFHNAMNEVWW
jgi:hypothetical protein